MRDISNAETSIAGDPIGSHNRPVQFGSGRVCGEDDCATRRSIYNADPFCSVHGGRPHLKSPSTRRRRRPSRRIEVTTDDLTQAAS